MARNMQQNRPCRRLALWGLAVLAILVLVAAGCFTEPQQSSDPEQQSPDISSQPTVTEKTVTLYFSDEQAMYLKPETRVVTSSQKPLEQVIVEELIKGPRDSKLQITVPKEARLISVQVVDKTAQLNFSREFQSKHWGGSTGEMMTLYSITNSLCKLDGIEKVQFLLEGEQVESILGHSDTTMPIAPNWDLIAK